MTDAYARSDSDHSTNQRSPRHWCYKPFSSQFTCWNSHHSSTTLSSGLPQWYAMITPVNTNQTSANIFIYICINIYICIYMNILCVAQERLAKWWKCCRAIREAIALTQGEIWAMSNHQYSTRHISHMFIMIFFKRIYMQLNNVCEHLNIYIYIGKRVLRCGRSHITLHIYLDTKPNFFFLSANTFSIIANIQVRVLRGFVPRSRQCFVSWYKLMHWILNLSTYGEMDFVNWWVNIYYVRYLI